MNDYFKAFILEKTQAQSITKTSQIQELWSGYGAILRVNLNKAPVESVVVKHVALPKKNSHPRGWNTDLGHQRKVTSYNVETTWYDTYSSLSKARLPHCIAIEKFDEEVLMILEDLDGAGFSLRKHSLAWDEIDKCLAWLADFHASYLGVQPTGLWDVGTYWHLETRPHELERLHDRQLKDAAPIIDEKLNSCTYKTFVHGDAKLANFCSAKNGDVAGVDFQYVGGGCGMKDVAYFIGSCLSESDCERFEEAILDSYFTHLSSALGERNDALESEWRALYRVAWADFHRFLKGWSPGHWKINSYSERLTKEVIKNL